jgi:hypothetical protein
MVQPTGLSIAMYRNSVQSRVTTPGFQPVLDLCLEAFRIFPVSDVNPVSLIMAFGPACLTLMRQLSS